MSNDARLCHCGTLEEARHTAEAILITLLSPAWDKPEQNCAYWAIQVAVILRAAAFKYAEEFHGTERHVCEELNAKVTRHFVHHHMTTPDVIQAVLDEGVLLKSFSSKGVPYHGGVAMSTGWDIKANPHEKQTCEHLDWIAQWHVANAECFRDHVHGGNDKIGTPVGNA
jgi:hypothetical protein